MNDPLMCRFCGRETPARERRGGRAKQFCSDTCRVKFAYRNRNGVTTNRQRLERHLSEPYVARQMSEPEKAWLAAMIDGEGCIGVIKHQKGEGGRWYFKPYVSVANTNVAIINRVVEIVGNDSVKVQYRSREKERTKPIRNVHVGRVAIRDVLKNVRPYLVAKGRQADVVMEFCRVHDDLPCKTTPLNEFNEMWKECAVLNKRGI